MERTAAQNPARQSRTCCESWGWIADGWPLSAIWRFCPGRDGARRAWSWEIATRLCSSSAAADASRQLRYARAFWSAAVLPPLLLRKNHDGILETRSWEQGS